MYLAPPPSPSPSNPTGVKQSLFPCRLLLAPGAVALCFFLSLVSVKADSVSALGLNDFQQTSVPTGIVASGAKLIAGREFSYALQSNGTLVGWGRKEGGRSTPPAGLTGVVALSAGIYHNLALKSDGTVVGWGLDNNRVLSIPAGLSQVIAVAAGGYHSLALRRDGTVVAWGFDGDGRTAVPAGLNNVIAIDAGRDFSVALKADGTVVAWGLGTDGQTNVPAGLSGVVAISAGENHTLALKADGTVVAWGMNVFGQTTVPTGLSKVVSISAGSQHSLALKSDGTVVGWGDNAQGQLKLTGSDIRAIAAGGLHSLALRGTGPMVTSQPRGQSTLAGSTVTLSATAAGTGLSYQWQLNGKDIAGATASTLTIANTDRSHAGIYTVKVTGPNGVVLSNDAALVVRGRLKPVPPQRLANGTMRVSFGDEYGEPISTADLGRYQIEVSSDMNSWTPLDQPVNVNNGRLQCDDSAAGLLPKRFYRAKQN